LTTLVPINAYENRGWPLVSRTGLVTIGKAAKKAGVTRQQLQYYIMVGLLEPTEITRTGRRLFDQNNIERIKLVKRLNEGGYTLRDIRETFLQDKTESKKGKSKK
jgi:DNA-binding transcriptional MerR regulator